ncbi:MAG: NAD(P)-dependent oxidoreductase [Burkholderiaceae bacterium]|nr:NAD(P)-dependent oxidoreductase [Burkholderiaceae bacterium]
MQTKPRIAFLGLGIMGLPMAGHLLKAGFPLTVYNRTASRASDLVRAGARQAATPAEAAPGADFVISIVTDGPDVEQVLLGPDGAVHGAQPGAVFIDMSTISPETARNLADRLSLHQIEFLDAPVSGGDVGARSATLTIMAGGKQDVFERSRPVLEVLGKRLTHVGPAGAGQVVKACNQVVTAVNLLAVCEALTLAEKNGIDQQTMIHVLAGGASQSWSLENMGPRIAKGDFTPGFMVKLLQKDLNIVLSLARRHGLALPGATLVQRFLEDNVAHGEAAEGSQALYKALKRAAE